MSYLKTQSSTHALSPSRYLDTSNSIYQYDLLSPKTTLREIKNSKIIEEIAVRKVNEESMIEKKRDLSILDKKSTVNTSKTNTSGNLNTSKSQAYLQKDPSIIPPTLKFASVEFNHKGFGNGFVSNTGRFVEDIYTNNGPGPGAYIQLTPEQQNTILSNGRPRKLKRPKIRPVYKGEVIPGPGDYVVKDDLLKKGSPTYNSVFQSSSVRNLVPKRDLPPSEVYDMSGSFVQKALSKPNKESASFVMPLNLTKPAHHVQPLVSNIYHRTQQDAYAMFPELHTESSFEKKSEFRLDKIKILTTTNGLLYKSPKSQMEPLTEKSRKKSKDAFFAGEFTLPRIHSFDPA